MAGRPQRTSMMPGAALLLVVPSELGAATGGSQSYLRDFGGNEGFLAERVVARPSRVHCRTCAKPHRHRPGCSFRRIA